MGKPAARITDMHTCPMVTPGLPPVPHVGGPVTGPGVPTVLIGGMPAAVMGDMCVCVGPPDSIMLGSTGVMIGGKPAARMGDTTAHGGVIVGGLPTVLIGETSWGSVVAIAGAFAEGLADDLKQAIEGAANAVAHPVETAEGLGNAVANYNKTGVAIKNSVVEKYNSFINGDAIVKAAIAGGLVGEILQLIGGELTEVGKVGEAEKLTEAEKLADFISQNGRLPDSFMTKKEAAKLGWEPKKGNLGEVAPGKSIGGDIYKNKSNPKIPEPDVPGRVWYEADVNYKGGKRGAERVVYSNDGIIYKTDHYKTWEKIK